MADLSKIKLNGSIYNFKDAEARAILTDYSGMTDAEYQAGTSTANRLITPARLKAAILYYSP